jgi:hypothetical protein
VSRTSAEFGITSAGTRVVTDAMHATSVKRMVVAGPNRRSVTLLRVFMRTVFSPIAKTSFGKRQADVALTENLLVPTAWPRTAAGLPC